ncbi:hypothetical protein VN0196_01400 [Helicobacter pylori]
MKDKKNNRTLEYLYYKAFEGDIGLSFFDFIQKLEQLKKTHTIKFSACNVRNRHVTSYSILLQKKAG